MYRLDWPEQWVANVSKIGWVLLGAAAIAWAVGWYSFLLFIPLVGATMCFLLSRRMRNTAMLAVENGELLCHISAGPGGGQLFKTYRYALTSIDHVEEQLFPMSSDRARSKFFLELRREKVNVISEALGGGGVWLIPQPLDERMRDAMREFLKHHIPGGVTERVMDKPPWKT